MDSYEREAYWYVVSMCGDKNLPSDMTRGHFDIVSMDGEVDYIAAAKWIKHRLEQIEMGKWCVTVLESHLSELDGDSRRAAYVAILERERAALADLKQGIKC